MENKFETAWKIAATEDVSTPENSVVLYSVSYQKSDINKHLAMQYIAQHKESRTLDDTPCGKKLIALGLETDYSAPQDELMKIWALASKRFILAAAGNITAFVENADKRSTFLAVELPLVLQNKKISQINRIDKFEFAKKFD